MKAAVVTGFSAPLEIREVPIPEPGPGDVLVRMETSGLCHTDIHAAHGDWPVKPTPPFIPGHEGIGVVVELGAGVTDPVEAIQALGGADVAVALAANPQSFDQAFRSLRRGGRLVCVALPGDNGALSLPIFDTVLNAKTVIGSIVGTRNDLADVFALHAAGRTRVIAVDRKLDDVNQSIADVLAGDVPARVVFQF